METWLESIASAMPEIVWKCNGRLKRVAIDSTSGTFILASKTGDPLLPPAMYYEKDLPAVLRLRSKGIPLNPSSPLDIKERMPNIYEKAR